MMSLHKICKTNFKFVGGKRILIHLSILILPLPPHLPRNQKSAIHLRHIIHTINLAVYKMASISIQKKSWAVAILTTYVMYLSEGTWILQLSDDSTCGDPIAV